MDYILNFDLTSDANKSDPSKGDRIQLPTAITSAWFAGTISATTIDAAITSVFTDADRSTGGNRALGANEAVIFSYSSSTYLMVMAPNATSPDSSKDLFIRMGSGLSSLTIGSFDQSRMFTTGS